MALPKLSAGTSWSEEEDERLYREFEALVSKFEGRSFAAVMSRVAHLSGVWWVRRRDVHKDGWSGVRR